MAIPNDPVMLLSFVNMKLRDETPSLTEFCKTYSVEEADLREKLSMIDYEYDPDTNQFV